jgi:hypothetical protein
VGLERGMVMVCALDLVEIQRIQGSLRSLVRYLDKVHS